MAMAVPQFEPGRAMALASVHALPAMSFLALFLRVAFRGVLAYIYGYGCERSEKSDGQSDFDGSSLAKNVCGGSER